MSQIRNTAEEHRKLALMIAVFLFYLFYLFSNLNIYLYYSLRETWFVLAVPVLVAGVLYFGRHWDKWEYRLMVAYCTWFLISRMLHDNIALTEDFMKTVDVFLLIPFFALGLCLKTEERRRFLDVFSAVIGVFYFLLGVLCIFSALYRIEFINPISQQYLCKMRTETGFSRLIIMDINPDTTNCWFMNSFFLMVYQFFACRKKWWRIPAVLCAVVDYVVLSICYVRSVMVAFSVAMGLLSALMILRHFKGKTGLRAFAGMSVVFLITASVVFLGFGVVFRSYGHLSVELRYPNASQEEKQEYYLRDFTNPKKITGNNLTEISTGRDWIYRSAFVTIRENPSILLTGTLTKDTTEIATDYLREHGRYKPDRELDHFQNFLLQVMVLTGLPGLLLVLAVCVLLARSALRLFFCEPERVPIFVQTLMLPVLGAMIYGMFEITYFTNADHCSLMFYLMGGMMTGWYYDIFPINDKGAVRA